MAPKAATQKKSRKKPGSKGGFRPGAGRKQLHAEGLVGRITVAVPTALIADLDAWAAELQVSRSAAATEAIRRLVG